MKFVQVFKNEFTQEVTPGHAYLATFEVKKSESGLLQARLGLKVWSAEFHSVCKTLQQKKDDITVAVLNIPLTHMW